MGEDKELHPQVVLMSMLKSGDEGVHENNDVANVAIIDQDVTELSVNMGNMCSRKTEHWMCLRTVCTSCCVHV